MPERLRLTEQRLNYAIDGPLTQYMTHAREIKGGMEDRNSHYTVLLRTEIRGPRNILCIYNCNKQCGHTNQ
jgi:hypothetical protein